MAERISALDGHYQPGRYGNPGATGVNMVLLPELHLWQLAAWPATAERIEADAWRLIDAPSSVVRGVLPMNYVLQGQHGTVLRTEPLKWWLLDVTPTLPDPTIGTILDLSHSRVRLRIIGEEASSLLSRFVPLDLRWSGQDSVMSTAIHHVGVTLWQSAEGFELFIPRGFSVSIVELLCQGAEQFGYELR